MKRLRRTWDFLTLILKDSLFRRLVRSGLFHLASLKELSPHDFSRDLKKWSKSLSRLQQYHSQFFSRSGIPDDLSLIDSYPWVKQRIEEEIASFQYQPLITLIVPVYGESTELLEVTFKSVSQQFYQRIEVCILVDTKLQTKAEEVAAQTFAGWSTVRQKSFANLGENLEAAFNEVLGECEGAFMAFLSAGDTLSRVALLSIVRALNQSTEVDVIYSDAGKKAADYLIRNVHN